MCIRDRSRQVGHLQRLRKETTLSMKWVAHTVGIPIYGLTTFSVCCEIGLGMRRLLLNYWQNLCGWHRASLRHAVTIRRSRTLPLWLALIAITFDFCAVAVWYRYSRELSIGAWTVSDA